MPTDRAWTSFRDALPPEDRKFLLYDTVGKAVDVAWHDVMLPEFGGEAFYRTAFETIAIPLSERDLDELWWAEIPKLPDE